MNATPAEHIRSHLRVYNALPEPGECRRLRVEAGVPQQVVAEAVGVTRSAISAYEAGKRRPTRAVIGRYVAVLAELKQAVAA